MPLLRQDMATITVDLPDMSPALPPPPNGGSWSMLEGGDLESEDTKVRPGGMVGQVNLGGPTTRTDATVSRPYSSEIHPFIKRLENQAGNGSMKIHWTAMNAAKQALGNVFTITGILKNVTRPNWDSNATGAAMLAVVMGCDVEGQQTQ